MERETEFLKNNSFHETLLKSHIKTYGLLTQQIRSFNHFVDYRIKTIVTSNNPVLFPDFPGLQLRFTDVRVGNAINPHNKNIPITPLECTLRNLTYSAPIYLDIEFVNNDLKSFRKDIALGDLPIMVHSNRCTLYAKTEEDLISMKQCTADPGGYFVVGGTEKALLIQEQTLPNSFILLTDSKGLKTCFISSVDENTKTRATLILKNNSIFLRHNSLLDDIPIFLVLKALGFSNDKEIIKMIGIQEKLVSVLFEDLYKSCNQPTIEKCVVYLGNKIKSYIAQKHANKKARASEFLDVILLPHIQTIAVEFFSEEKPLLRKVKGKTLCWMIRQLLLWETSKNKNWEHSQDDLSCKTFELAGELIGVLFEDLFKKVCADIIRLVKNSSSKSVLRNEFDLARFIRPDIITNGLRVSIATGNWYLGRFRMSRVNITSTLPRISHLAVLEMLSRVNSSLGKSTKISGPRSLQSNCWGLICPVDTPEGESIGLVKHLALLSTLTLQSSKSDAKFILKKLISNYELSFQTIENLESYSDEKYMVSIEGELLGIIKEGSRFINEIIKARRKGEISKHTNFNINHLHRLISVFCSSGRPCRALIVVENGKPLVKNSDVKELQEGKKTIETLILEGKIEYCDANEERNAEIAINLGQLNKNHTHLELDSVSILGILASLIPFANHNQAPRNTYQCSMGKQSVCISSFNHQFRMDSAAYTLIYGQTPLVKTKTQDPMGLQKLPTGTNAILAVLSHSGYDIEDAVVLNRASLDRGFARCLIYKRIECLLEQNSIGISEQIRPKFDPTDTGLIKLRKKALDRDGLPKIATKMRPAEISFNKFAPVENKELEKEKTRSAIAGFLQEKQEFERAFTIFRGKNNVRVDAVYITANMKTNALFKLRTRECRTPELGDKFSSRHGQKGVCGLIENQENMPFTEKGIIPDIIMNPHGFPSRMTVGKIIELVIGKTVALEGKIKDGSSFENISMDEIKGILKENGFNFSGKEKLISGITGKSLKAEIFIGPVYYQRLKHMVADKLHSRTTGPNTILTRQPTEGRSKDGGLRLGEMERDCLISHGCSFLLNERMLKASDQYLTYFCQSCGFLGYNGFCSFCKNGSKLKEIKMGYACKLMFQELYAMGVFPKIYLE